MKTHIPRLKPKVIKYRSYKKFDPASFLQDVKNTDFKVDSNDTDLSYRNLSSAFRKLVDKHAPLKTRVQRGNTAPFMNLQLQKAIYARSRLKKKFNKNSTTENRIKFNKKQQNKCVSIRKKAMKSHFKEVTKNGIMSNKEFWNLVKSFLSNKGGLKILIIISTIFIQDSLFSKDITAITKGPVNDIFLVHSTAIVTDEQELTEIFNDHYINLGE